MQQTPSIRKRWTLFVVSALALPLLTVGCSSAPQVPASLPELPKRPSVNMPPRPTEILQSVENDMQRWEKQQQQRVQRLTP